MKPTFSLNIGNLSTSTDNPVGGPQKLVIERDMDIPADSMELLLMERSNINLNDDVSISLGYDGEQETVFSGNVIALQPAIVGVKVRALGNMNALLNLRTSATYENQTAGNIANDLISQAGLTAGNVDAGPSLARFNVDKRLSAFKHLKNLANRLGYELYTDRDGNILFHALGPASGLDAVGGAAGSVAAGLGAAGGTGYVFGQHLIGAGANQQSAAWSKIEVGGESPMSGQGDTTAHWLTINDADYRGTAGDGAPNLLVHDPLARTKDLADRFAAGKLALAKREAHQVSIMVMGQPQLDLGENISSSNVPDELINGSGYIRAIRHLFGEEVGFITNLRISLDVA